MTSVRDVLMFAAGIGALGASLMFALGEVRHWRHRPRRDATGAEPNRGRCEAPDEQPATTQFLDRCLRTLAGATTKDNRALPAVRSAVVLSAGGLLLHPVSAVEPAPAPFTALPDVQPTVWSLRRDAELLDEVAMAAVPAPYPTLVTLGSDDVGNLVLVNLREIGAMVVSGTSSDIGSVLVGMAVDLAASDWARDVVVTLVGVGRDIAGFFPDRLRYAESIDDVLDSFARCAHADRDGRVGLPLAVIVSADPLTVRQRDRLAELIDQGMPAAGVAAVITGGDPVHAPIGAWHLDASRRLNTVDALGIRLRLQRLSESDRQQLVHAVEEMHRNDPVDPQCGNDDVSGEEVRPLTHSPKINLLGVVRLTGVDPDQVEAKKLNRLTEVAAYLVLHPRTSGVELSRQLVLQPHGVMFDALSLVVASAGSGLVESTPV